MSPKTTLKICSACFWAPSLSPETCSLLCIRAALIKAKAKVKLCWVTEIWPGFSFALIPSSVISLVLHDEEEEPSVRLQAALQFDVSHQKTQSSAFWLCKKFIKPSLDLRKKNMFGFIFPYISDFIFKFSSTPSTSPSRLISQAQEVSTPLLCSTHKDTHSEKIKKQHVSKRQCISPQSTEPRQWEKKKKHTTAEE